MVEMALNQGRAYWLVALVVINVGVLTSWTLIRKQAPATLTMSMEMSSTTNSEAQVYYDIGENFKESDSATVPVAGDNKFHELRFPLPRKTLLKFRFDPLKHPGSVDIRNVRIVDAEGKLLRAIQPPEIKTFAQISELAEIPGGVRAKTLDDSTDSALIVDFASPLQVAAEAPSVDHTVRDRWLVIAVSVLAALILVLPGLRATLAGQWLLAL
jgi:hypothetical protein